jgi:hypothetical protein
MSPPNANPNRDLGRHDAVLGGIYFRSLTGRLRQLTGDGRPGSQCFYMNISDLQVGARWYLDDVQVMILRESFEEREVVLGIALPDVVKQMYVRTRQAHVDAGRCFQLLDPLATHNGIFLLVIRDHETYQWMKRELQWLKSVCYGCYER